ncbi:MAG: hypothetical protein Q8P01_03855 [bacterium]|nr:hypothetical protein [bacterium]
MRISIKKEILAGTVMLAILGLSIFLLTKTAAGQTTSPTRTCPSNQIAVCARTDDATGLCTNFVCESIEQLAKVKGLTNTGVTTVEDVRGVVQDIVGWMQIFFYIVATLLMILAAWDYLNSGGDETKTKAAKNKVLYSLVAIAIAVIAGGIVTLVKNFVG